MSPQPARSSAESSIMARYIGVAIAISALTGYVTLRLYVRL